MVIVRDGLRWLRIIEELNFVVFSFSFCISCILVTYSYNASFLLISFDWRCWLGLVLPLGCLITAVGRAIMYGVTDYALNYSKYYNRPCQTSIFLFETSRSFLLFKTIGAVTPSSPRDYTSPWAFCIVAYQRKPYSSLRPTSIFRPPVFHARPTQTSWSRERNEVAAHRS